MLPLPSSGVVPSWDERARAEELREARLRARRARDGWLPAHVIDADGNLWPLRPLPYPYRNAG